MLARTWMLPVTSRYSVSTQLGVYHTEHAGLLAAAWALLVARARS